MTTEMIVKLSMALMIIIGYGVIIIAYMYFRAHGMEESDTLKAILAGLTTGYAIVLNNIFKNGV